VFSEIYPMATTSEKGEKFFRDVGLVVSELITEIYETEAENMFE
jgi:hypothetical protein